MFTHKRASRILRANVKGIGAKVPTRTRKKVDFVYLDNAASTPALSSVLEELDEFLNFYSGVHRGTGYKSLISSKIYDECHHSIGSFVGADLDKDVVIMVGNTTEAINKLSYSLPLQANDVVVTTAMEHHSNDLPWRARGEVKYAALDDKGMLNLADVEKCLRESYGRVKLLAVCGASNVTGHINNVHLLAAMAHEYGCKILVDGAQLVPHQAFDMKPHSHPEHIDYLAFSGHKIHAPFGVGVLIGHKDTFLNNVPVYPGGGTVKLVMDEQVFWADPPDKEEAGSPNVVGTFALARTLNYLDNLGMNILTQHEQRLTSYALQKLKSLNSVVVYGTQPRVGVISFNIKGLPHALVGSALGFEAGIGVRTGCFCAQRYVRHLLALDEDAQYLELFEQKEFAKLPGMVRISLSAYNSFEEIDYLTKWIKYLSENRFALRKEYSFSPLHGYYLPNDPSIDEFINKTCHQYMLPGS